MKIDVYADVDAVANKASRTIHTNIICMRGRTVGPEVAWDLVQTYLAPNTAGPRDIFHVRQHRAAHCFGQGRRA